jgi:hypothetical protein
MAEPQSQMSLPEHVHEHVPEHVHEWAFDIFRSTGLRTGLPDFFGTTYQNGKNIPK